MGIEEADLPTPPWLAANMLVDEKIARKARLAVCSDAFEMTVAERADVLRALGLMVDPLHKEIYIPEKRKFN